MTNYPRDKFVPSSVGEGYADTTYHDVISSAYPTVRGANGRVVLPGDNTDISDDLETIGFFIED